MDFEKFIHYAEWLLTAFLTIVFGLKYSIDVDLVTILFSTGSTAVSVIGLLAIILGGTSVYRLILAVADEF